MATDKLGVFVDDWADCYHDAWTGGLVVDGAMSHPAKFARGLIARIFQHAKAEGWITPHVTILDPFGGVALGALEAMTYGCHWTGVEVEEKFVALGNGNIALWNKRFAGLPGWGAARLLHGDSRQLGAVLQDRTDLVCSSPPFSDSLCSGVVSAKMLTDMASRGHRPSASGAQAAYGAAPGQLGGLPEGSIDTLVSSPPFQEAQTGRGIAQQGVTSRRSEPEMVGARTYTPGNQGQTPGNLAAMAAGRLDALVSSPPFLDARQDTTRPHPPASMDGDLAEKDGRLHRLGACAYGATEGQLQAMKEGASIGADNSLSTGDYGQALGQLGTEHGETFWSASRQILEQCFLLLKPGAHAIFVLKGFVRKGKLVDFPHQWQALCVAVGFVTLHEHHALLTTTLDEQMHLDGSSTRRTIERKSFFRRLAEKRGSPKIDYETVLCLVKPDSARKEDV